MIVATTPEDLLGPLVLAELVAIAAGQSPRQLPFTTFQPITQQTDGSTVFTLERDGVQAQLQFQVQPVPSRYDVLLVTEHGIKRCFRAPWDRTPKPCGPWTVPMAGYGRAPQAQRGVVSQLARALVHCALTHAA